MNMIIGKVIDSTTYFPIDNASIFLNYINGRSHKINLVTNTDGDFVLEDISITSFQLQVNKEGYLDQNIQLNIHELLNDKILIRMESER